MYCKSSYTKEPHNNMGFTNCPRIEQTYRELNSPPNLGTLTLVLIAQFIKIS